MTLNTHKFAVEDYPIWKMFPEALEIPGSAIFLMLSRNYAPYEKRMKAISSRIGQLPRYLTQYRTRFDRTRTVTHWTEMAIETCRGFPAFLKYVGESSKDTIPESLHSEMLRNIERAEAASVDHLKFLEELLKNATPDFAMGKARFAKLMRIRLMTLTPDEMLAIGMRTLEELKQEKARLLEKMAPKGGGEADVYRQVHADCAPTFEGVIEMVARDIQNAKEFIIKNQIATIDPGTVIRVLETPEFLTYSVPSAALTMPARFESVQGGEYLITRPKNPEEIGALWNRSSIINTSVHEAFPGHFHQGVMANRKPWMHSLANWLIGSDTMVTSWETMEGWAHYCEKMMYDHGYEASDAAYLAMLDGAIWRACRVVYDIKLAYGEASIQEMAEMLAKEASTPYDAALSDVKGFSRAPGYAVSYLIGRYLVFELKREFQNELGPEFDEKKFHDLLAENGNLPLYLARKAVRLGLRAGIR
jgi:uncharacterized protein (DUF885 family)